MLTIAADGVHEIVTLGSDIEAGMLPQHMVPGGVWQGSHLVDGQWALMGTTMSPPFCRDDFCVGRATRNDCPLPGRGGEDSVADLIPELS